MNDLIKELESAIIEVYDVNGVIIPFTKKELKYYKHKNSSAKNENLTLFLDDIPYTGKKLKYHVKYRCNCGNEPTIYLSKYLKKTRLKCDKCREDEEKVSWHKLYFQMKKNGENRGNRIHENTVYDFDKESDEFKEDYYKRNLTVEEFNIAKKYIYSLGNKIVYGKDMILLEHEPAKCQKKYSQYVLVDGEKVRLTDIQLKCPLCGEIFHITRMLKERVKSHNFDCKPCTFSKKTFGIKKYADKLTYQSGQEKRFIDMCIERNILIENGKKINYIFNNLPKIYITDFYLPQYKFMIEIKDNHIWHKRQVEIGKWAAKENAAIEYGKENNMIYFLLFEKDFKNFFDNLERDSLNSIER